jgi:SAM-dependent methyltransferase
MAITAIEYKLLRDFARRDDLPKHPAVIEFGESNWYGDVSIAQLEADIDQLVGDPSARAELRTRLALEAKRLAAGEDDAGWRIAKIAYATFLGHESLIAVDMGGRTEEALKLDLNEPVKLPRQYDIAINFGTAEHIFDVRRFFATVHEATRPGGLMIHSAPFRGWLDHGFYNIQPTFYADLALANGYAPVAMAIAEIHPPKLVALKNREHILELGLAKALPENGLYYAVLRKGPEESPFRVPMQGYYSGSLSDRAAKLWEEMR